jgi:hypothetical protein
MTLSDEERDLATALAAHEQLSISDYIRRLLRREAGKHLPPQTIGRSVTKSGTKAGNKR